MQQTEKYQFNLIEGGDNFSPNPLNENMEKVEAQLEEVEEQFGAVDKSLAAVAANLGAGGKNCRIAWGTYTGSGTYGSASQSSLTVDFYPVAVIIGSGENVDSTTWPTILLRGCTKGCSEYSSTNTLAVTWLDAGVRWYCTNHASGQNNKNGIVYYYCIIGCDNS